MNVPIFVTPECAQHAAFSTPVWARALGDGFLARRGNPKTLTSYEALTTQADARLLIVGGQVQADSDRAEGVADGQLVVFRNQTEALVALLAGEIEAFAATAIGSRAAADGDSAVEGVAHEAGQGAKVPIGAFSFAKGNHSLLLAVNEQLRRHLGTADHRARMAKYGITRAEIDAVLPAKSARGAWRP